MNLEIISEQDSWLKNSLKYLNFGRIAKQEKLRIDKFLMDRIPNTSRNKIQIAAHNGNILVNKLKVKKFIEISNENHELALWALEEKLNPSDEIIGLKDAKVILNNVRKMFFNEFFLSMSLIYNTQIKSPVDIVKARTFLRYKI